MGGLSDQKRIRIAKEQRGRCFYCHLRMHPDDMTWEHLVARAHGGSDRISNLRVTHGACNAAVGILPLATKFGLHLIGRDLGSDAFFIIVSKMRSEAHARVPGHSRRPRRPSPEMQAAVVRRLIRQLPDDMQPIELLEAA